MSIKGIDTQLMVTRATDTLKDASLLQRHPQATQETLAERTKAESVLQQSMVEHTLETEMQNIRTDVDGGNAGSGGGGGREEEEEEEVEEITPDLMVAPADHDQIIDIMI